MQPVQLESSRPTKAAWASAMIPALIIVCWLAIAAIGGPYFGRVSEVSSNDQTSYLPTSAEATQVQKRLGEFRDSDAIPAVVAFTSDSPLSGEELEELGELVSDLKQIPGVGEDTSPLLPSEDGYAAQLFVPVDASLDVQETVHEISALLQAGVPAEVNVYVTGPAGFTADLVEAFSGIDGLLLGVAILAVLIILVVVYRSLLLPLAVLSTSIFALTAALLTVWWLAKAGLFLLSGQTQGILFILVIGAATDYSLLYVARYREELRLHQDKGIATRRALRGSVEPIVASGSTVIAGLLTLLLSDLKSNSTLGPVASVGIIFAMLSALTLLPAILYLLGRAAFWPRKPKYEPQVVAEQAGMPARGIWPRIAPLIRKRPRTIWLATTVILLVGAVGATQLEASGVPQSDLVLSESAARDGQVALGEHFPGGSGSPAYILVPEQDLERAAEILLSNPGVESVSVTSADSPSGTAPVTEAGIVAFGPPGTEPPNPTVSNGDVLLQATLVDPADSDSAGTTVLDLRQQLHQQIPEVAVGGVTATAMDTNAASIRDRTLIIPVVLLVILLILMVLLRSVLAPILLVVTTVISFGTALGVAALLFNHVFKFPGADPAVPLYSFVFLVALGIDYNIFLMTRVREESVTHGTRVGILRGLGITGGVITSAGLVLAATFAALSVIPILFLAQLSFIVAFGVLLDTFLVRSLLVPALTYDIGPAIWWPSKLSRQDGSK